jgi:pilus assembly protein CpaE
MIDVLRVCLFNPLPELRPPFRLPFDQLSGVEVISESTDWPELSEWLRHVKVDAIAIHLDGPGGSSLEIVRRVSQMCPTCGIIGVSSRTDPDGIIQSMRSGCTQFVCWPIDTRDLTAAVDRIRATRLTLRQESKRICVIGSAGGAGATTIACNLAIELGNLSAHRVAVVDLDVEFGDVNCLFDCEPKHSIADVAREGVDVDRVLLQQAMYELSCNVTLLARPEKIGQAREITAEGVDHLLRMMAEIYPFVVVDLPRAYSHLNAAAVRFADRVLIVSQLGVSFIRNATRVYELLLELDTDESTIEIVLNRSKASHGQITPADVEAHFGRPVFAMIPNDYRQVQSASDFGRSMLANAPTSPARLAIQEMARMLAGSSITEPTPLAPGLLGRFWKNRKTKV